MKKVVSCNQLSSDASLEPVSRPAPQEITDTMDRLCDELEDQKDPFVSLASQHILENTEW